MLLFEQRDYSLIPFSLKVQHKIDKNPANQTKRFYRQLKVILKTNRWDVWMVFMFQGIQAWEDQCRG